MINKNSSVSPKNLQRAFEHAVRDIYEAGANGRISQYRTPIGQRLRDGAHVSPETAEKKALSDAAKALAQLWKVSPHLSR